MVARDEPEAARDKRPIHGTQLLGLSTGNFGRQRLPDSGKTHCNWVSLRLQLYLLDWREQG